MIKLTKEPLTSAPSYYTCVFVSCLHQQHPLCVKNWSKFISVITSKRCLMRVPFLAWDQSQWSQSFPGAGTAQCINEQLHSCCLPEGSQHLWIYSCALRKKHSSKSKHECVLKIALLELAQPISKNSCNLAHASSSAQSVSQAIISTQQELESQFVTVRSWGRLFLLYDSIYNKYSIACHGKDVEHIYTSNLPFHIKFISLSGAFNRSLFPFVTFYMPPGSGEPIIFIRVQQRSCLPLKVNVAQI